MHQTLIARACDAIHVSRRLSRDLAGLHNDSEEGRLARDLLAKERELIAAIARLETLLDC